MLVNYVYVIRSRIALQESYSIIQLEFYKETNIYCQTYVRGRGRSHGNLTREIKSTSVLLKQSAREIHA